MKTIWSKWAADWHPVNFCGWLGFFFYHLKALQIQSPHLLVFRAFWVWWEHLLVFKTLFVRSGKTSLFSGLSKSHPEHIRSNPSNLIRSISPIRSVRSDPSNPIHPIQLIQSYLSDLIRPIRSGAGWRQKTFKKIEWKRDCFFLITKSEGLVIENVIIWIAFMSQSNYMA